MIKKRSTKRWDTHLQKFATRALGQQTAMQLEQKYQSLFSPDYQALISPRYALQDLLNLEQLHILQDQKVSLLRPCQGVADYRLHFYSREERFLDEYIPLLENMSLRVMDQVQFRITLDGNTQFIKSFTIKAAKSQAASLGQLRKHLLDGIQALLNGQLENDALNKLLVLTGMDWQEIDVLRAYRNYYLQLDHHTTRASIHHALINNPEAAHCLFNYFEARFRPNPEWHDLLEREEQALLPLRLQLLEKLAVIADMNDDRILRTFFNLIDATMRSNFALRNTLKDYFIAFKINSLGIIDMPLPKPQYEIYVHAVDMEGIHLRGGKISRGGIRWSDRADDFRTEILSLMQTQISKNALIIPTGAKGGFVLKKNGLKTSFPELRKSAQKAYIKLMRGLLTLTDNYVDEKIITSPNLVAYDDPDPYLVVAADKGTAQFSDIANGIAAEYQFWLDDAFASGGSKGYDHKALGITARGAWECVKRHFREIGKDIQTEPFTVVGIGSMDGDVFGNGMLLSPAIRLLAAFSGQHIFLDPNPDDLAAAFNERKRLFQLPGSTWNDYDRNLISKGGGVYLRSEKDIPLSTDVKKWLKLRYRSLDGESLIRHLLAAPVDLLWLGGIGTYVKASTEKHEEVGDRNNDNVRVDAENLNAMVVGEGANLGFTQKARIEYALHGGRINTDAVDNSAGVDTSDHEVNLKILLRGLHKKHLIDDYQALFNDMTDEVCRLVLANNIAQSQCLSLEQVRNKTKPKQYLQLAERLEAAGFLDKPVESFPPDKEILARTGQVLTRPELAVLMAASKMYLTLQIQNQDALLTQDCCGGYLQSYFPEAINAQFSDQLSTHPLAHEIKATIVSNKIINQAGCCFLNLDSDSENMSVIALVSCYLTFDRVIDGDELRQAISSANNNLAADQQYQLLLEIEKALTGICRWLQSQGQKIHPDMSTVNHYRRYLKDYYAHLQKNPSPQLTVALSHYQQAGIPPELAEKIAQLSYLNDFPFIVEMSNETGQELTVLLQLFDEINGFLSLPQIAEQLANIPSHDDWEQKILAGIAESTQQVIGSLIKNILLSKTESCAKYFALPAERPKLEQYRRCWQEINRALPTNLLAYVVLSRALEKLVS